MKRLVIIGLICCISIVNLVGCGKKERAVVKQDINNERSSEVDSPESLEDEYKSYEEFMANDLNQEEEMNLYLKRLEEIKKLYNEKGIKSLEPEHDYGYEVLEYYSHKDTDLSDKKDSDPNEHLSVSHHHYYISDTIEPHCISFNISYFLDSDKIENYSKGTEMFDVSNTVIPEVYKISSGRKLDEDNLNEVIAYAFKNNAEGISTFNEHLDLLGTGKFNIRSFMEIELSSGSISVTMRFPLREKM